MPTTTPRVISAQVRRFCGGHVKADAHPVFVPIASGPNDRVDDCFNNVRRRVEAVGGMPVYGWSIWIWEGVYIEAEHHAVWKSTDGSLIDVTPARENEKRRLFLPDPRYEYDFKTEKRRDNMRAALVNDPIVVEFLQVAAEWAAFMEAHSKGLEVTFTRAEALPLAHRQQEIVAALYRKYLGPNDLCPCASGRKVKRCHGLEAFR